MKPDRARKDSYKAIVEDWFDKKNRQNWLTWHLFPWFSFDRYGRAWILSAGFCTLFSVPRARDLVRKQRPTARKGE